MACETNVELSKYNFTWVIKNAGFGLLHELESGEFETEEGVFWKVSLEVEKDLWGTTYFKLALIRGSATHAMFEFFRLNSQKEEFRLTDSRHETFKAGCSKSVKSQDALITLRRYKAGPEDTLTIRCRLFTNRGGPLTKVTLMSKTNYDITVPPSQMPQALEDFLGNRLFTDVTLVVDGKNLKAHKAILAARSPVFAAMFSTDMIEKRQDLVTITDVDYEVAEQILRYIYTDQARIEPTMAHRLLAAADKYALLKLKAECEIAICENLTAATAVETVTLADRHSASQLKAHALRFIQGNSGKVLDDGDFKSMITELYHALNAK